MKFMRAVGLILFAISLVAACVGLSLSLLLFPPVVDGLVLVTHPDAQEAELQAVREVKLATLRYVTALPFEQKFPEERFDDIDISALNAAPYTADELSHLQDVRTLIGWALVATYAVAVVNTAILSATKHSAFARRSTRAAGIVCLVLPVVIAAALLLDFGQSFTAFHEVLFPQGNWMFPYDSLLITVNPAPFWQVCGLLWMGLLLLLGVILIAISCFCGEKYAWERIKA